MKFEYISPIVSVLALGISLFTLWFTILRRGEVRCTHPSLIAFRYDMGNGIAPQAKIFLRTLLYSTSKRGHVIEGLSLKVTEGDRQEEFAYWGYGEKDNLVRGSGLFVPDTGIATNHHFNPTSRYKFVLLSSGSYAIELVAKLAGRDDLLSLWHARVQVTSDVFNSGLINSSTVIYLNWSPEKKCYIESIESGP